ncbi:hypothetical protein ABMA46_03425 [Mesorhizobium sp. CN5-321]|uniref:cell division protein FtsL n=1 Tax=Mesorhizobium hunchu TaxID=3157708 RepID=UPI0032B765C0
MFRTSDIILIALMVSATAMTYKIKRDAEEQQTAVYRLQAQIRTENDTIDLLRADWSLLTQPARLEKLTDVYSAQLDLQPVDAHQFVKLGDLPAKPLTIEDLTKQGGDMADSGQDRIVTGAVQ